MMNVKPRKSALQVLGSIEPVIWMLAIIIAIFAFTGENFLSSAAAAGWEKVIPWYVKPVNSLTPF